MVTSGHVTEMAITPAIAEKPYTTCKPHGSIFYRTGVIADRSFTLQE